MANAAVVSNSKRIYDKTLAYLALSYAKGPQKLMDICLAVGYGPNSVQNALEKMVSENFVIATEDGFRFAYCIWDYRKKHYWKGPSYDWYLKRSAAKMPTFKRMRLTCDMLGCVIGFMNRRNDNALTVPEALEVMREMNWTKEFTKYAYGLSPSTLTNSKTLEHPSLGKVIKRMGDICGDIQDFRKIARCVQLQKLHSFGTAEAFEYMKSINGNYRKMNRLNYYMKKL